MIAGIFLCFVAMGITFGAMFYGLGSAFLIIALLPAAGMALGLVTLAAARNPQPEPSVLGDTRETSRITA